MLNFVHAATQKYLSFCFFLIMCSQAFGQNQHFKNISIKEGLPQSDVLDVAQDEIGYLWFATQGGGIAKYDGKTFKNYNQSNGLLSNFVNALSIHKHKLYVGTHKGLSIFHKGKFTNYPSPKVNAITQLNNETYLATKEGIYVFRKDYILPLKLNLKIDLSEIKSIRYTDSFYWIETPSDIWKTKTLHNPKAITKATKKEKILWLNKQQKTIQHYQKLPRFKTVSIVKIFRDKQNTLWILTRGQGVFQSIVNNFQHFDRINSQRIRQITAVHTSSDTVWFSDGFSLFKNDSIGIKSIPIQQHQFKTTSITTDAFHNLWVGSKNKGIYIFRKKRIVYS